MKPYLLGVDCGGTYIKAAVFDHTGKQLSLVKKRNECLTPGIGMAEYDQDTLWKLACACIRNAIVRANVSPDAIACVGISGQGCGVYAVDAKGGNIRNAISSSDQRAAAYAQRWKEDGTSASVMEQTFRAPTAGHPVTILAWLKDHEPENYYKISRVFAMKDLLIYRLTGNAVAGMGCQSASCLMDVNTGRFLPSLAQTFGVQEMDGKFGETKWDVEICGQITSEAAMACGCAAGTPVCGGCHDVVASIIAMGIEDSQPCFVITGTHAINGYLSEHPVLSEKVTSTELFAVPGSYLIEESYPASSGVLEWVIDALYEDSDRPRSEIYGEVSGLVEDVAPESCDLVFLPYLRGRRDNIATRAAWIGLMPSHTRAHMLRATYEAVAFTHMWHLENLFCTRSVPETIRMAGGATNSSVWSQMFADVIGIPMEVVPKEELGSKGAAIVAAVAIGIYPDLKSAIEHMASRRVLVRPRLDANEVYKRKYERFKAIVKETDSLWPYFREF